MLFSKTKKTFLKGCTPYNSVYMTASKWQNNDKDQISRCQGLKGWVALTIQSTQMFWEDTNLFSVLVVVTAA